MEDQDPFSEFGGKEVPKKTSETTDPFSEFGGKSLKKKVSKVESPTGGSPVKNGSSNFQYNNPFERNQSDFSIAQPQQKEPKIKLSLGNKRQNTLTSDINNQGGLYDAIGDEFSGGRHSAVQDALSQKLVQSAQAYQQANPNQQIVNQEQDQLQAGDAGRGAINKISDKLGLSTLAGGFASSIYKPLAGATRILNDGVGAIYKGLTGKEYLPESDKRGLFGELSDDAEQQGERSSKIRNQEGATIAGDVYHGLIATAPLIMGTMLTGGENVATQAPQVISTLTKYLAGTGALKAYDTSRLEGKDVLESGKEAVKGGFKGAEEGLTIEAQMALGRAFGKGAVNALVEKGLFKGGELSAKLLDAIGVGSVAAGTSIGKNLLNGEDINLREAATQAGMMGAFEVPGIIKGASKEIAEGQQKNQINEAIIKNIADRHQENKIASFINSTPEQINGIMEMNKSHDQLFADSVEQGIKAGESKDAESKRNGYIAQIGLMNAANIKEVSSEIAKDPTKFIEGIQQSELPPEVKQEITQKVQDIYINHNPIEKVKTELADHINQADEIVKQHTEYASQSSDPIEKVESEVIAKQAKEVSDKAKKELQSVVEKQMLPIENEPLNQLQNEKSINEKNGDINDRQEDGQKEISQGEFEKGLENGQKINEEVLKETGVEKSAPVLKKAEDDLSGLKQVTDKTKKYEASIKRLIEAKRNGDIDEKQFNDIKSRFDNVLAKSGTEVPRISELTKQEGEKQNATKIGEIEQGNQPEYKGIDRQQQGKGANRGTQEKYEQQAEAKTGNSDINERSREKQKIGDPLRTFADKIREGKINKLSGFRSGTGFDVVWDGGLEVIAKSIEGGANLADAINAGLKTIKESDWYKNIPNKDDFDKQYVDHLKESYIDNDKLSFKNRAHQTLTDKELSSRINQLHDSDKNDWRLNDEKASLINEKSERLAIELKNSDIKDVPGILKKIQDFGRKVVPEKQIALIEKVVEKYTDPSDLGKLELVSDLKESLLTLSKTISSKDKLIPESMILRESVKELKNRGFSDIDITDIAKSEFEKYNYKEQEIKAKIESILNPILAQEGKSVSSVIREFAQKIRNGKINKLGGFRSSTGFDGAWDLGLETVAKTLEAGAKLADAIESGLKAIKQTDWYKQLSNKDDFDSQYKDHMRKEYDQFSSVEKGAQGISKEETRKQREYRGEADLEPREAKTLEGMFEEGKKAVEEGIIDPRLLASEVFNKARNISPTEVNALLYDRQRIKNEIESIHDSLDEAIKNGDKDKIEPLMKRQEYLERQRTMTEEAVRTGSNQNALAQVSMRSMTNKDYSRSDQEARMRSKNGGELTESMKDEIKKYSDLLKEANLKLKEFEEKQTEQNAKREVEKQKKQYRENKKSIDKETLKKERNEIVNDFRAEIKKIRQSTSSVAVPYARELVASVPFVSKMLTNLTKEGIVEFKDIVSRIHSEFKDDIEGLTERDIMDVISGKYNEKKETKNDLLRKKNEIIRLSRLTTKLEDLQSGLIKEKSESKKINKRAEILDLEKQVSALEKELGISPEERAKQTLKNQLKNITDRINKGDFERPDVKPKSELDDETITLRAKVKKAQNNFDAMAERLDKKNESKFNKALDTYSDINRMFLLSGVKTLGKLYSFAAQRAISTPIEELFNTMNSKLPLLKRIAERSPRFAGGLNVRAEAKAIAAKVSKASWKDTYEVLKNGASELDILYGKSGVDRDFSLNPSALEFFGRLHGAFKNSTKRAEFYRSYEKRLEYAARNGKDINDPNVQFATGLEAYADGKRSILMHDNKLTDGYKSFLRAIEGKKDWEGKSIATLFRTLLPIIKIPTNYALEALDTSTFGVRALPYVFKAAIKGAESLTPAQATMVMRSLAKGQFGLAMMTIAYFNPQVFGGYYSGKRKDDDLKAGDVILNGVHLPHFMTHHPILEAMQIAATMRRAIDAANGNGDSQGIMEDLTSKNRDAIIEQAKDKMDPKLKTPQTTTVSYDGVDYNVEFKNGEANKITKDTGFRTGLKTSISGLSGQVPFFETPGQVSAGLKSDNKMNKFEGDFLRNRLEPRLLQEAANFSDKDTDLKFTDSPLSYLNSEVVKRDPKTILEHLKIGIPYLRQQVGEKVSGNVKLQQIKVGTDKYELNKDQVKEREKYIEEFNKEFAVDITEQMKEDKKTNKDISLYINRKALDYSEAMMIEKYGNPENDKLALKMKNQ